MCQLSSLVPAARGGFMDPILLGAVAAALLCTGFLVVVLRKQGRAHTVRGAGLTAYAKANGYGYTPGVVDGLEKHYPDLHALRAGWTPRFRRVVHGTRDGLAFRAFEYTARGSSAAASSSAVTLTYFAGDLDAEQKALSIQPRGFLRRLLGRPPVALQDVADAAFHRRYRIQTEAPEFARHLLQGGAANPVREALRADPRNRLLIKGRHVVAVRTGSVEADRVASMLTLALAVHGRLAVE